MQLTNLPEDHLFSLQEVTRIIPKRPHVSTVWRWATRGVRGVRLKTHLIGGRRFVANADLSEFIDRLSGHNEVETKVGKLGERATAAEHRLRSEGF
jgi:hypothetical protein